MKQILIVLLSVLMMLGCKSGAEYAVSGNGKIVSYEVPVDNYSQINVSGHCELIYEQKINKSPYLKVEIDGNLKNRVRVDSRRGSLSVGLKGNVSDSKLKIYTNSNMLEKLNILGVGKVTLKNKINSPNLDISISGVGNLKADKLKCTDLTLSMSGTGNMDLDGETYNAEIKISGSGDIDAFKLKAQNVRSRISGSGDAKVYASGLLDARVSGTGNIEYKGSPKKKDIKVSGVGKVIAK